MMKILCNVVGVLLAALFYVLSLVFTVVAKLAAKLAILTVGLWLLLWLASWFVGPALTKVMLLVGISPLWKLSLAIGTVFFVLRIGFNWITGKA